jgi:hypothetical protein
MEMRSISMAGPPKRHIQPERYAPFFLKNVNMNKNIEKIY